MDEHRVTYEGKTIGRVRYRAEAGGWEWVEVHGIESDRIYPSQDAAESDLLSEHLREEAARKREAQRS